MSKTFTYTKIVKECYLENSDEFEYEGIDFDYEIEDSDLIDAVSFLVYQDYFNSGELSCEVRYVDKVNKGIRQFIEDNDLLEELVERYEDELKEYFEEDAMNYYDSIVE